MYDYQGMVILAANQVWWTWEVEDVFRKVKRGDKMGMKNYSKKLHGQIDDLVVQVRVHTQRIRCLLEHPLTTVFVYYCQGRCMSGSDYSCLQRRMQVRSQLSKNDRKKFNSVLIVDVHNRDIIDRFVRDR